ncbi:MAG: DNA primase [Gemmatimonadaceae bacterium]|nr:DNA primase [Gemmatimonadaceae bacterium]NUP73014.1 DNA primase [Gemmatimonadaceae bacterium]NUR32618.1 DNA primase [Gemmatimonadaceae bacterium]
MIADETVERVRESADIVGVIGEYVELKRQGSDFRGPCPFHQGTHRNFSVSPKKQMYYCFVCHEGGDVFNFLTKRLGVDWPTAVRMVAEKSGIEVVETQSRRGPEEKDDREPFWEVNAAAADYFRKMLWEDDLGREARAYVEQRDISRELADRVGLGFAPREIGLMRSYLNTLGFEDDRLTEAGLLATPEGSTEPRPRFRGRLIFPIYDVSSRVVGFGGRLLGPGEPKYLNSPESRIFSKGRLLYGLNWAKQAARRDERMLVVEGYFDAVRLIGAGVESVVAPMGTALTEDQAKLIRRYTDRVYLLYDSDKAGLKATFRSGDELLRQGASVQVVTLPEGEDPDSFVRTHGARGLDAQLAASIDVFERKIQILERGGWFADLRKKRQALDRLLPTLRATSDPLTRDMYLGHASDAAGVTRELLERELNAGPRSRMGRAGRDPGPAVAHAAEQRGRPTPPPDMARVRRGDRRRTTERGTGAERELLRVVLHRPAYFEQVVERVGVEQFRDPELQRIFAAMIEAGPDASPEALAAGLDEDSVAVLQELLEETGGLEFAEKTIVGGLAVLHERELTGRMEEIDRLMPLANGREKDALMSEKMELVRELGRLGSRRYKGFSPRS